MEDDISFNFFFFLKKKEQDDNEDIDCAELLDSRCFSGIGRIGRFVYSLKVGAQIHVI